MKPQMLAKEIKLMERILSSCGPRVDILEWGSGGSTVYFTKFLRERGILYTWTSVEYNKVWHERVAGMVKDDPNTEVVLFDAGNTELQQRENPMDEYVAYPRSLNKKFDIVFVDGRKRRRCLLEAKHLLKPKGRALLHDARRTYYHCAFSLYPDRRMLLWSGLWQGCLEKPRLLRKALNASKYWALRVYTFMFRIPLLSLIPRYVEKRIWRGYKESV